MTYATYANKPISEKIVLCHIEPKQRLSVFSLDSGTIYKKSVNHCVIDVNEDGSSLTEASSASLSSGEWYYDYLTGDLYLNTSDDADPKTHKIIVTYRLFYSNTAMALPYDLDAGYDVYYEPRLKSNSPINKQLDEEQIGVVLETSTGIKLENSDGYFDDIYDVLFWENKSIKIWSWSDKLTLSEKQKLFDGVIQNKSFSTSEISFSCKDFLINLRQNMALENFSSSDGVVPERYLNTPKRRLFGQFKQLQCVPIDAILDGYNLTSTCFGASGTSTITGSGFLSEVSPEDVLIFETDTQNYKFTVKSVDSDTSLTTTSELDVSLDSAQLKVSPRRPYRLKNRSWHIAGHKLRSPSTTVISASQANRIVLTSTADLFPNDLIKVDGESAFIKRISGNNVTLTANLQGGIPSGGESVTRSPVSKAFINGSEVFIDRDWSVTNGASDAILELDELAEFNVAPVIDLGFDLTFTASSRLITVSGTDMTSQLQTRDWIRSDDISHTTWYEVLDVVYDNDSGTSTITTRVAYAGSTTTTNGQKKNISLINDNSVITVNCYGQERDGTWVKTASDAVKDMLENDADLSNLNTDSFTEADNDAPFILSYAIPKRIGGRNLKIKDVISEINKSVFGSLVNDSDFNLKYQILTPEKPNDMQELKDDDISTSNISVRSRNEIVRKVNAKYGPYSDKFDGSDAFELYEFTNEFVDDLIGAKAEMDLTLYLYKLDDATTIAQRYALYNSLSQSTITFTGKLNLALKNLNDKILLNLDRLYKRLGNKDRRKIGIINSVKNDGVNVTLTVNDLGNNFNRVGNISSATAADFTSATDDEIIFNSYIVDAEVLTPDTSSDDEIFNNLIG